MMILTLLIALLSLVILMVIHEFGHFIIAKKFGVKVEEFGIGYPPRIYGKKFGETLYSINLIHFGAFVKIYGEEGKESDIDDYRSFSSLAIWKRILIVLGGVIAFWIAAFVIFSVLFSIGATVPVGDQDVSGVDKVNLTVMSVQKDSPAEAAGVLAGDVIVEVKNETGSVTTNKIGEFQQFIKDDMGKPVMLVIKRQSGDINIMVNPRVAPGPNEGALGIDIERLAEIIKKYPFYQAPWEGAKFTFDVTIKSLQGIYGVLAGLFMGKGVPQGAELAGPIGITIFLANAASYGPGFFLYFIGSISVLIAIFNLFPIPALDGGKLLFLIIEKIQKKPVPVNWEQTITIVCFLLLISMSIFVTVRFDIPRVMDFWKAGL